MPRPKRKPASSAMADDDDDAKAKWKKNISKVVEGECVGRLHVVIKRASFIKVIKKTGMLRKINKAVEDPQLYVEATLGECKAVTGADIKNGQHPEWEVRF